MIAGSRAKVTDFGMSKLASVDPRMTPLTQCPGNMLYMSPEALSEEPTYTKNLDIFSLGVLVVQILTREFPDPTARFEKVDMSHDPKLSCKTVQVAVPEVERRSNHLSLINDGNPLKTLALECLRDAEKSRPTAQELNVTLGEMKQSEQYKESVKLWSDEVETSAKGSGVSRARLTSLRLQVQDLKQREMKQQQKLSLQQLGYETAQRKALQDAQMDVQRLQGALKEKERQLQEVGSCLEREKILKAVVEAKDAELRKIQQKFVEVQHTEMRLRSQIEAKDRELYKCREELQAKNQENLDLRQRISTHPPSTLSFQKPGLPVEKPVPTPRNAHIALRLERKIPSPYSLKRGSMAVYKKTAFITSEGSNKVYQITLGVDRWNVLPDHNHFSFGLAVFDGGFVTSVGGWNGTAYSNKLLTLNQDRRWVESYPAMPTARIEASVVSAQNVLVVTGGYNGVQLDIVEVLTLYNKQWATAPRLPQPFYMASALVCDNQLYLAGGYVAPDVKSKSVLTCSIADLLHSPRSRYQQVWTEAGKLPYYKCTLVSQGEVLMAVGGKGDMGEAMSDVLVYEPHSESWRRVSNLAIARNQCFAFSFSGDVLYLVSRARRGFQSHRTLPVRYREQQLMNLKRLIDDNMERLLQALHKDLHKCETEAVLMEIDFITKDIVYMLDNLLEWMAPNHRPRGLANIGHKECYPVVTGGVSVSKAVLRERYDYIFYTGNSQVGKIVMEHAARNLTPVTLELGGKSPAIIADDADLKVAAQRIMWGKCLNAGQTCIAPDYVLCPPGKVDQFVEYCKQAATKRVMGLLSRSRGRVVMGGESEVSQRYIAPTVVAGVTAEDSLMEEEIFGPVLPVISVDSVDDAIAFVNKLEKPLSFYVFTANGATFKRINQLTSAGGVVHNDVIMHASVISLPFGGVGHSGMGVYHFQHSFETFSHIKPVVQTSTGLEALNQMLRVPPYTKTQLKRVKWLLAPPRKRSPWLGRLFLLCLLAVLGALLARRFEWMTRWM
ncbi:Aldehyde dehydrogenase family 3 member A2 [Geodia barretti]|uniref:Aldehyde dehydrogenase family 3 member A2 n=1 Tax=Geodia barretti TaxID=519541 RepID=A0AA35T1W7_GEOBA|nr:Aldehyde dehydrogenase family 3 member A2 [Geodia barretti]